MPKTPKQFRLETRTIEQLKALAKLDKNETKAVSKAIALYYALKIALGEL